MGTQIHSNTQYRTAVKLVQSGVIGKVREVCSWSGKTWGYDGPKPEPGAVPASLDWNLWLGTAADRPFCPGHYHPGNWRRWYDFGGGTMGDMAIHILGTLANRFPGDELRWQPAAMTIPNHDKADALLRRKYRTGFEVDNLS